MNAFSIAAGGAVAFIGQYLGPHHEYHHHFQANYGLNSIDVGEITNNLVT